MEHNKEKLKAPNEGELESIEQLQDHSDLAFLYPKAKRQWSGKLLSENERNTKRDAHLEQITRSIRKHFFSIGFLIPLPIFLFVLFVVTGQQFIKSAQDFAFYVIPFAVILCILTWLTVMSVKKVRKIFYDHAIAIGPFYLTLVILLLPAGLTTYLLTLATHESKLLPATVTVGLVEIVLSIVFSFLLLFIWTTPKLSGQWKMAVLYILAGSLIIAAAACAGVHLANNL